MPVRFPMGMALERICGAITAAWLKMASGVSSTSPFGAAENPGSVGDAA
jgi:hypothetical protein